VALVEGGSLADRLQQQGRFEDPGEAVALVTAVADALAAVHASGVVHRDVKPGNVLLDRAGMPYLSDFGLAHADDGQHLTATGTMMGTPAYLAPEQAAFDLGATPNQHAPPCSIWSRFSRGQPAPTPGMGERAGGDADATTGCFPCE
jgi:serine/threonine protein kinase